MFDFRGRKRSFPPTQAEIDRNPPVRHHIVKPAFVYRHQWRPGDVLMWDNCLVQHRAIQDYELPRRRLMHRTTMGGTVPA